MQAVVNAFFEEIKQTADRHGIDFMQMINSLSAGLFERSTMVLFLFEVLHPLNIP